MGASAAFQIDSEERRGTGTLAVVPEVGRKPWERCRPEGQNRTNEPRSLRRRRQRSSGTTWRMTTVLALKSAGCGFGICSCRYITTFGGDVGTYPSAVSR